MLIKVLFVVSNNVMHGTERYVFELAKFLPKNIYDVYIAVPSKGSFSDILKENQLKEIIYNNESLNKFTFKGALNLLKIIRQGKFDIIHANTGIVPCILGKISGVKLCVEIKHGIFFSDSQLENLSYKIFLKEYIKQFFVDFFIAISDNDKERLIKYFKIKSRKIKVIYNGLYSEQIDRQIKDLTTESPNTKITLGTIGRYNYQKAYDVLVNAISLLVNNFKDFEFYFIGTGEEEQKIKTLVKEKNLEGYIKFIGYTKEIFKYMKMFDIFVLTSRYEGVPYVILEAMYMGIPIVCTDVGGISNILKNEKDACVTRVESPDETSESILKLIQNRSLTNSFIENCKDIVKYYSVNKMAQDTSNLYLKELKIN